MDNKELFEMLNQRFDKIDKRFEKMDERMDKMEQRMDNIEQKQENMSNIMDSDHKGIFDVFERYEASVENMYQENRKRILVLEKKLKIANM